MGGGPNGPYLSEEINNGLGFRTTPFPAWAKGLNGRLLTDGGSSDARVTGGVYALYSGTT